jgi:hypothetical protein
MVPPPDARNLEAAGPRLGRWLLLFIALLARLVWSIGPFSIRLIGVVVIFLGFPFFLLDTKRDLAYRYSDPASSACRIQMENVSALAPVDNDETSTELSSEIRSERVFTCMVQKHAVKSLTAASTDPGNPSLMYYLSFLEFQENGEPVQYGEDKQLLKRSQFQVLLTHLKTQREAGRQNFILAFIHGWRHDARIGDENVKNTRLLAAYLTSFLEQRCVKYQRYCKVAVTAVYFGWRALDLTKILFHRL